VRTGSCGLKLGNRRLRFTDEQRRSLAVKARLVGRKLLADVATIVTPETLLGWHRSLSPGRPGLGKKTFSVAILLSATNRQGQAGKRMPTAYHSVSTDPRV
jgi:hypothetical protein